MVNRKFLDSQYGGPEGAKAAAIAARQRGLEDYLDHLRRNLVKRMKGSSSENDKRAPYTLFMPPENPEVPVWRYMDFTKFVSMLENGALFLPMVAKLDDPFEGSYARGNETLRPLVYRHLPSAFGLTAGEMVLRLRGSVAASCWHSNEQESAAMWRLYAQSNEAVCIQTTFASFVRRSAPWRGSAWCVTWITRPDGSPKAIRWPRSSTNENRLSMKERCGP